MPIWRRSLPEYQLTEAGCLPARLPLSEIFRALAAPVARPSVTPANSIHWLIA